MRFIACEVKQLPEAEQVEAAEHAVEVNPMNAPNPVKVGQLEAAGVTLQRPHLALLTNKWWGPSVDLSVSFEEQTDAALRDRIIEHMNAWGKFGNVRFRWAGTQGDVRISRAQGGYWSYLGTDIRLVTGPTMNLEGFTMQTPESEYRRVVRHETGHTLGFPHEHLRKELIARIDPAKAYQWFRDTYGWDKAMVDGNVLTPLDDKDLRETPEADQLSIMCYMLPGAITTDGQPIVGGGDIDAADGRFAADVYPPVAPPPPVLPSRLQLKVRLDKGPTQLFRKAGLRYQPVGTHAGADHGTAPGKYKLVVESGDVKKPDALPKGADPVELVGWVITQLEARVTADQLKAIISASRLPDRVKQFLLIGLALGLWG